MTPTERAEKRAAWLNRIRNEIRRREAPAFGDEVGDAREQLLAKLKEMGDRLGSDPNIVPLTPAQQHRVGEWFGRLLKERGYGIDRSG